MKIDMYIELIDDMNTTNDYLEQLKISSINELEDNCSLSLIDIMKKNISPLFKIGEVKTKFVDN